MTKTQPTYFQGIEFIRLSSLPFRQYRDFVNWLSPLSIFHLSINGETYDDCVTYSEYDHWFELNVGESHLELKYSF